MKKILSLCLVLCVISAFNTGKVSAQSNLTPRENTFVVGTGNCVLPTNITVGVDTSLGDDVRADAQKFVNDINTSMTGYNASISQDIDDAFIRLRATSSSRYGSEGYLLDVTPSAIEVTSSTSAGFFYGLQSVKKMLPANVSLNLAGASGVQYTLPCCQISDVPRFGYRGFMLDCSRHFFDVAEIKKILDIMSIYKLNTFHWHLTDDQGWRAEIKKYPNLTIAGAVRSNSWNTDIHLVNNYWWTGEGANTGQQYGPYFYTQEQMREVVAYAAARHIEVIPEVEMPGHAVAAMVAYPEYSCNPGAQRSVWTSGGVSSDVMNVANAGTVQFCKDIIDELCDIFPGRYIHIGGDECPSTAWENNTECQNLKQQMGFTSFRQLQSYFTNQISAYIATKGKRTIVWNESITANGSDINLVKEHNPIIMCWNPCQGGAQQAVNNGLDAIITEYHSNGGYYINRRQSNDYGEPTGAGAGDDTVEKCYNYVPIQNGSTSAHYLGVQGTFWTEHVSSNEYLEYLAIPRLMCIAEAGWSQQNQKDWNNFKARLTTDTEMLDLGGYIYGKHWMDGYRHRVNVAPIHDGAVLTFLNKSTDRGRGLTDENGTLNGQSNTTSEWRLESNGNNGQYYIKSCVSNKYLYVSPATSGTMVTLSATDKTAWTFDETTISGYVAICPVGDTSLAINNNAGNTTKTRLFAHGSGNGSSFWIAQSGEAPEENIFTCHVSGNVNGRIIYNGIEYNDGGTFEAQYDSRLLSVKPVEGYVSELRISGTDIYAEYTVDYSFNPEEKWEGRTIAAIGGEVTGTLTPSTEQWYLLKQSRPTWGSAETISETPAYDNGANATLMRAATGTDVHTGDEAADVKQYLVRILPGDFQNSVKFQFGTGRFMGTSPVASTTAGNYLIYPATQKTSGWTGHWAINKTSDGNTYQDRLDNNGAGGTLAFWGTGQLTTSDANNVWALYPVTVSADPAEIEIIIGDSGCATFACPLALDFTGTGLQAYVCTGTNTEGKAVMQAVEKIEAETPVYVTADAAGRYTVPVINIVDPEEYAGTNALAGNLSGYSFIIYQTDGDNTNFVLQKKTGDENARFYKVNRMGNLIANSRAWLQVPQSQAASSKEIIEIEIGDPTAINAVDAANAKANAKAIFDLLGRKVRADYRGVVIKSGKKVLKK